MSYKPEEVRIRAASLVAALALAVLSYTLNATMITPLLPEIGRRLAPEGGDISLVSSLFFLSGSVAGIVLSRWSDFVGRRAVLLGALAATALGTLVCIFAPSLPVLLLGRVIQGSSSAVFQLAYIVLVETLSAAQFGVALGVITAVNGGFGGVDGYLAGVISRSFGYQAVFVCILGIGILAWLLLGQIMHPAPPPRRHEKMDWPGAAILSAGLVALMTGVSRGSASGWLAPATLALFAAAALFFTLFWRVERRRRWPLIEVRHFRSRRIWPILATTILTLGGVFAVINFTVILLSQNAEIGFGLAPEKSALLFLSPPALIGVAAAPASGWLAGRWGWGRTMTLGQACCIATLALIALFPFDKAVVAAAVAALGIFYNGLALTTVNGLGVFLSPEEAPAALPGLNGAAFGIGASLGIAIVAPFVLAGTAGGIRTALWISVGVTLLALAAGRFVPAFATIADRRIDAH
jgi:predicted MFS family arabinose efflux permease